MASYHLSFTRSGESVYSLKDANDLRIKLLRLSDSVNATAQKIRSLGPVEIGYPEGGKAYYVSPLYEDTHWKQ